MTDRINDEAKLLADAFSSDWAAGPLSHSARAAAKCARRRRTLRIAAAVTVPVALVGAAIGLATWHLHDRSSTPGRQYQLLSDAEVFAQVHDRPLLALRDGNRIRQIVVLETTDGEAR